MKSLRWVLACCVLSLGVTGCTLDRGGIAPDDGGGTGGVGGSGGTGGMDGGMCPETPCENDGVCLDGICDCSGTGYAGAFCETDIDECLDNMTCMNGGICSNTMGGFMCDCSLIDFEGDNCETMIDDCDGIDCLNGGTCVDGNRVFTCDCAEGWTNDAMTGLCDVLVEDCTTPGVCQNGTCDNGPPLTCTCDPGWHGVSCNILDDCMTPPDAPMNATVTVSGTNYNDTADYVCNPGYDGGMQTLTCGDDENWSPANPTLTCTIKDCGILTPPANGAVSTPEGTTFGATATYSCDAGYTLNGSAATMCDASGNWTNPPPTCDEIADCSPNPCMNGGTCNELPGPGNYSCTCPSNWTGTNCETDVDECGGGLGPCDANGASACVNSSGSYSCTCNMGYQGMNCDGCAAGFIMSNATPGTCVDDPCDPTPCTGSSTCSVNAMDQSVCTETCDDGINNQDETDTDCGGTMCPTCADGLMCIDDTDCTSGICPFTNGICGLLSLGDPCARDEECTSGTCDPVIPRTCI